MQFRIKGYLFEVPDIYSAGYVLTRGEAQALNQLRGENVQDNLRKNILAELGCLAPGEILAGEAYARLQKAVVDYAGRFVFKERHVSKKAGILDGEILAVALEKVAAEAQREGRELSEGERQALASEWESLPEVIEEARRRLRAKQEAAQENLMGLL